VGDVKSHPLEPLSVTFSTCLSFASKGLGFKGLGFCGRVFGLSIEVLGALDDVQHSRECDQG
jgi:hypothetical protein